MAYTDYVYKNRPDTVRFSISRHPQGGWDYLVFNRVAGKRDYRYTSKYGESPFRRKKDAKASIERDYGKVTSINPKGAITEGWD
jgi:hypothetical protein